MYTVVTLLKMSQMSITLSLHLKIIEKKSPDFCPLEFGNSVLFIYIWLDSLHFGIGNMVSENTIHWWQWK